MANMAPIPAVGGQLNLLSFVQVSGARACQPKVLASLPISVGTYPEAECKELGSAYRFLFLLRRCSVQRSIVYSSDHGAVVGNAILTGLSQ